MLAYIYTYIFSLIFSHDPNTHKHRRFRGVKDSKIVTLNTTRDKASIKAKIIWDGYWLVCAAVCTSFILYNTKYLMLSWTLFESKSNHHKVLNAGFSAFLW